MDHQELKFEDFQSPIKYNKENIYMEENQNQTEDYYHNEDNLHDFNNFTKDFFCSHTQIPPEKPKRNIEETTKIPSQNRQKNCPKLFGKKLNSTIRGNKHFNDKKLEIFNNDNEKIKKFDNWVDQNCFEKLNKLKDFQNIWTIKEEQNDQEFRKAFKQLSLLFFSKFAVRYIVNSGIKDDAKKKLYLKLIPMYIKGIKNPDSFKCLIPSKQN